MLACAGAIGGGLGSVPALVYRIEGDARVEAFGHPLRRLTRNGANDRMSWPDFIEHLVEAEFARSILAPGLELELDLSGFLRGDPLTRWQTHQIAIDTGVLDADEVRQVEGWNPRATPAKPASVAERQTGSAA